MTILFISDLHLSPNRPDITQRFLHFIDQHACHAEKLYILGDLFDFWLGDDDDSDFANTIRTAFLSLTQIGVECYFIHGNRDFLVGKKFSQQTGVVLLEEECKIDLYGCPAILLHGDTLCVEDVKYQEFRAKVHQPWLQWLFRRIPLFIRKKIVRNIQGQARDDKKSKSLAIMDVTTSEVSAVMQKHQVEVMIHGHTHRPATHDIALHSGSGRRIVLGDWDECGYLLSVTEQGFKTEILKDDR